METTRDLLGNRRKEGWAVSPDRRVTTGYPINRVLFPCDEGEKGRQGETDSIVHPHSRQGRKGGQSRQHVTWRGRLAEGCRHPVGAQLLPLARSNGKG